MSNIAYVRPCRTQVNGIGAAAAAAAVAFSAGSVSVKRHHPRP